MSQLDKPFVITLTSMLTGAATMGISFLQMNGYLTPKGADAANQLIEFLAGAGIVAVSSWIYHLHHAEVIKAQMSQPTASQPTATVATSPVSQ